MRRALLFILGLLAISAVAQGNSPQEVPGTKVAISKLSPPSYPKLARQARITGTVHLRVAVMPDGVVESVTVIDGHPMLATAATDSARQSEFKCHECSETTTDFEIAYKFGLGDAVLCSGIDATGHGIYDQSSYSQVSQSENTITIFDRPFATCDPAQSVTKVRSPRCLYLWRCGTRYGLPAYSPTLRIGKGEWF
jgi:TonB family protein